VEESGQILIPSQPSNRSPITYDDEIRAISISGMPEYTYLLPQTASVAVWETYGGIAALGADNGSLIILDFTELLPGDL
jgi:hypothetical protein